MNEPDPRLTAFAETIAGGFSSTVVPVRRIDTSGEHALSGLGEMGSPVAEADRLILKETLGEGGMGVVRLAEQRSVGREVAVKTLRPAVDPSDGVVVLAILREAWVTGRLEHPNIVPIYDVGLDDDGRPLIVLKRIEGEVWSDVMQGAPERTTLHGGRSSIGANLAILDHVADAIRYAHSHGIIHRDIKPENVMIGRFGEVYLVDWGIAVSLRDDAEGRLPLVRDDTTIAGTPAYMAPEMLEGGDALSERTDIYLLGAVLYEIVVGRPPHGGSDARGVIGAIALSEPEIPESVPEDLRTILETALARDPADRFPTVLAFQQALAELSEHRESRRLVEEAQRCLRQLQERAAEESPDAERVYDLFGECRFGFQSALERWPGNVEARRGLRAARTAMVEYELSRDDPEAAAGHLRALDEPPETIEARVQRAVAARRTAQESLRVEAERGRSEDPARGRKGRAVAATISSAVLTCFAFAGAMLYPEPADYDYTVSVGGSTLAGVGVLAIAFLFRRTLMGTAFNRRASALVMAAVVAVPTLHLGSMLGGLDPVVSQVHGLIIYASLSLVATAVLDRRFAFPTLVLAGCYLVAAQVPEWRMFALATGALSMTVTIPWVWRA